MARDTVLRIAYAACYEGPSDQAHLWALRMLRQFQATGGMGDLRNYVRAAAVADDAAIRARYAAKAIASLDEAADA
jgi:hypothetical protein